MSDTLYVLEDEMVEREGDKIPWPTYTAVQELSTYNEWFPTYRWSSTRIALKLAVCREEICQDYGRALNCGLRSHLGRIDW